MTSDPEFFLYTRDDCSLCDEMIAGLENLLSGYTYKCHVIKIDNEPELEHRYGARIPVLEADGNILCENRINDSSILQYLAQFGC